MPAKIFISYKRDDEPSKALLAALRARLKDRVFVDVMMPGGDAWRKRIREEIEKREIFVLLLSRQAAEPPSYVRKELD